jgi:CBS domain containing-hemolysin-like protein
MLIPAGVILLLVLLTALYVAAEFAAVGARRSRIRRMAEDGHPLAARALPVIEDPRQLDRFIAGCQVGIRLSSLRAGAYALAVPAPPAAPLLTRWFALEAESALQIAAIVILAALTVLSVILGELVPKAVALANPTQTLIYTFVPMEWSLRAYAWLIAVLNGSGNLVLRAFGLASTGHRHVHSPEEIALLIAESRDGGLLEPQEQVRLHRALRLGLRNARQLMVPRDRLAALDVTTPWHDVLKIVATSPYSRLAVFRGTLDRVLGILHTKDVVTHFLEQRERGSLNNLVRPVQRVPDTMSADRLLAFLRERRAHQALVVDESNRVVGLITLEDVLGELLGSVPDEFKTPRLLPLRLSDGRVRLPGELPLERARVWVGGAWPADPVTVDQFIVREAARVPEPAERLSVCGLSVEIESADEQHITSAIVTPPDMSGEAPA